MFLGCVLNRYPNQARARRGFALVGCVFLGFGTFMGIIGSGIGAVIGGVLGFALLLPPLILGESSFIRFEKRLSKIASFGSL
ncbi:hypothetical protein CDO35_06980 [Pseudomonas sediminis]|uniref:Uncharacterized protein n=1 Tax=Pseudomonas sediminis TaxID=1691904 RepID=A0A2G5FRV4_9PSED|nr:hypothetical protein CDO35_06980 [Pseudomonas sediminis]